MARKNFKYENIAFKYSLIKENRKTISASVFPNGVIGIKAPLYAKQDKIDNFLKHKLRWILKQQRFFSQFKGTRKKEYVSGETFLYLGRQYKLLVKHTNGQERAALDKGVITVHSNNPKKAMRTKQLLEYWYQCKANKVFAERYKQCLKFFNYDRQPSLTIRKLNRRWGSYLRSSKIILNTELIKASKQHIDYVIIHELCHLQHLRHDKNFYRLMEEKIPNWENIKADLELTLMSGN